MTHALLAKAGEPDTLDDARAQYALVTGQEDTVAFLPAKIEDLQWGAEMLMRSGIVPHLVDQPGRCLAVSYAAARFNMDLVAFASQTYFTPVKGAALPGGTKPERMAYMSQLVTAIIYARAPLVGRLRPTFHGAGAKRYCVVKGRVRGEAKPFVYTSPAFGSIMPKHSPLWFTDPDQQLAYYSQRAWARRYTPDVLLGVYDKDEFPDDVMEREARAQANPFADEDEPTPEPSGGADWDLKPVVKEWGNDDSYRGKADKPKAEKPPEKPTEERLAELRSWLAERQVAVLALKTTKEVDDAGIAMKKTVEWKTLVAHAKPLTEKVWTTMGAHYAALEVAAPPAEDEDDQFPGDR